MADVHNHIMNPDGTVGSIIVDTTWSAGWTIARTFEVGGRDYLFLMKTGTGDVHIHSLEPNGQVGAKIADYTWSAGWTQATFYNIGATTYMHLLKSQ